MENNIISWQKIECPGHCKRVFSTKHSFRNHLATEVYGTELLALIDWLNWGKCVDESETFECNLCSKARSVTKLGLLMHIANQHGKLDHFLTKVESGLLLLGAAKKKFILRSCSKNTTDTKSWNKTDTKSWNKTDTKSWNKPPWR